MASPSNPTGTVLTRAELFELIDWCKSKKVWFVSDEIYHKIEYGEERATTALAAPGGAETCLVRNTRQSFIPETIPDPTRRLHPQHPIPPTALLTSSDRSHRPQPPLRAVIDR